MLNGIEGCENCFYTLCHWMRFFLSPVFPGYEVSTPMEMIHFVLWLFVFAFARWNIGFHQQLLTKWMSKTFLFFFVICRQTQPIFVMPLLFAWNNRREEYADELSIFFMHFSCSSSLSFSPTSLLFTGHSKSDKFHLRSWLTWLIFHSSVLEFQGR